MRTPHDVNTTSNWPSSTSGSDSTSLWMKVARAERPTSSARARACAIASPEKSAPVTTAPILAQLSVSRPKWHCRCSRDVPSWMSGPSSSRSMFVSELRPLLKPSTSYRSDSTCTPTRSSQLARFAFR